MKIATVGGEQDAPGMVGAQGHHHHLMTFESFYNKPVRRRPLARMLGEAGGSKARSPPGDGIRAMHAPHSVSSFFFSSSISTDSVCSPGSGPGLTRILTEGSGGPAASSSVLPSGFAEAGGGELGAGGSGGSLGSGGSWGAGWSVAPEPSSPPASCELLA